MDQPIVEGVVDAANAAGEFIVDDVGDFFKEDVADFFEEDIGNAVNPGNW